MTSEHWKPTPGPLRRIVRRLLRRGKIEDGPKPVAIWRGVCDSPPGERLTPEEEMQILIRFGPLAVLDETLRREEED